MTTHSNSFFRTCRILTVMCLAMGPRTVAGGELAVAIRTDDAKAFASAMAAKPDVNELDAGGLSPLYHAVVARNPQVVGALLAAGAQPVVPGQSGDPLVAATINGDREIIASLLDKGADPAAGNTGSRPLDAAVASGRVEVLRQLLRAKPDAELPLTEIENGSPVNVMVNALALRHPAMAAELVSLMGRKQDPKVLHWLLVNAVGYEPEPPTVLIGVLLKAGVDPLANRSDRFPESVWFEPWNAAEMAAAKGRAEWLGTFLSGADRLPPLGANRILSLALRSGDRVTIDTARKRLPNAVPVAPAMPEGWHDELVGPEEDPRTSWDTLQAGEMVLRKAEKASAASARSGAATTVAVLAGKDCGNERDWVIAALSEGEERWQVVERDEVGALLEERSFDFAKPTGLVEIGDKLRAAFLVMMSKPGKGDQRVMRVEVVEVATGMVVRRIHLSADGQETGMAAIVNTLGKAVADAASAGATRHAITLLGVGALPGMTHRDTARSLVSAGLLAEVDATRGCVAITRNQMEPLVAERALGGEGAVWRTGWSLTAGVGSPGPERLELRLRLKNLVSGQQFDVSGEASVTAIRDLVRDTWTKAVAKANLGEIRNDGPRAGGLEGKELLSEARWRVGLKEYDSAARVADAAHFVGFTDPAVQLVRIQARIMALGETGGITASPAETGWVLSRLPDLVETIEIMNEQQRPLLEHLLAIEREVLRNGGNPPPLGPGFWFKVLVAARSTLPPTGFNQARAEMLEQFDLGLEQWCRSTFNRLQQDGRVGRVVFDPMSVLNGVRGLDPRYFPWLPDLATEYFSAECLETHDYRPLGELVENGECCQDEGWYIRRNPLGKGIRAKILTRLSCLESGLKERLAAEMAYISASDMDRCDRAHQIADLRVKALFGPAGGKGEIFPNKQLARYRVQAPGRSYNTILPDREDSLCAGIVPPAAAVGELFREFDLYQAWLGRPKDRADLLKTLSAAAEAAAGRERRPGIGRLRSRVELAAKLEGLTSEEVEPLIKRLPEDLPPKPRRPSRD
jgi:hypothetical protein